MIFFWEAIQILRDTLRGARQCHQITHGVEGPKIGQKSVTYYLNGPLTQKTKRAILFSERVKFLKTKFLDADEIIAHGKTKQKRP